MTFAYGFIAGVVAVLATGYIAWRLIFEPGMAF